MIVFLNTNGICSFTIFLIIRFYINRKDDRCRYFEIRSWSKVIPLIFHLTNTTKQQMDVNIENLLDIGTVDFPENISRQAVSKARHGIKPELFKIIFYQATEIFYQNLGESAKELWKGIYSIFAIDGSKFELPVSPSNFAVFGEMFSSENPKRRWSQALVSTIYDVMNDFIPHAVVMPYLGSEREAALRHFEALEKLKILSGNSILIFDRGYYSEDMFRYFCSKGNFCVMRIKEGYNLSKRCKGDTMDVLYGNPKAGTEDIAIRVIRIDLGNGTTEYLATNLFDKVLTISDFRDLYFKRWPIELKYKELKSQIQIEEFIGTSSISVEQEIFISLLYSNLAALVKKQADKDISENANPDNKFDYQSKRSFSIGRIRKTFTYVICRAWGQSEIDRLFNRAAKSKSQIQPERKVPRKKPKKERTHFNNRKPCMV